MINGYIHFDSNLSCLSVVVFLSLFFPLQFLVIYLVPQIALVGSLVMNTTMRINSTCLILCDFLFVELLKSCKFLSILILLSCQFHHDYGSLSLPTPTELLTLQTTINCLLVIRIKRTRVETGVYFFPGIFDSFHLVHLLCLLH